MDYQDLAPGRGLGPAEEQFQAGYRIRHGHAMQVYGAVYRQTGQIALGRWYLYWHIAVTPGLFWNTVAIQPSNLGPAYAFLRRKPGYGTRTLDGISLDRFALDSGNPIRISLLPGRRWSCRSGCLSVPAVLPGVPLGRILLPVLENIAEIHQSTSV
jgi:hypothetical protein